jgi:hypothetical protein
MLFVLFLLAGRAGRQALLLFGGDIVAINSEQAGVRIASLCLQ